jgi:hypothetical protein
MTENFVVEAEDSDSMCCINGETYDVDSWLHFGAEYVHVIATDESEIGALKDVGQLRTLSDGGDTFMWMIVPRSAFSKIYEISDWEDDLPAEVSEIADRHFNPEKHA